MISAVLIDEKNSPLCSQNSGIFLVAMPVPSRSPIFIRGIICR